MVRGYPGRIYSCRIQGHSRIGYIVFFKAARPGYNAERGAIKIRSNEVGQRDTTMRAS